MIKTAGRSPTKRRQTSGRNAGQGAAERKKHKRLKLGEVKAYNCSVG